MQEHIFYMRRAIDLARCSAEEGEVPVGAVMVKGSDIIASGRNLRESLQDPTAHAEMIAIRQAAERTGSWRLDDCTLYVTLEPCAMCAGAIVQARVSRLAYGARDMKGGFCSSLGDIVRDARLNHRCEVIEGVLARECGEILSTFFNSLRSGN